MRDKMKHGGESTISSSWFYCQCFRETSVMRMWVNITLPVNPSHRHTRLIRIYIWYMWSICAATSTMYGLVCSCCSVKSNTLDKFCVTTVYTDCTCMRPLEAPQSAVSHCTRIINDRLLSIAARVPLPGRTGVASFDYVIKRTVKYIISQTASNVSIFAWRIHLTSRLFTRARARRSARDDVAGA